MRSIKFNNNLLQTNQSSIFLQNYNQTFMIKRHNQQTNCSKKQHTFNDIKQKISFLDQKDKRNNYSQKENWIQTDMTFFQDVPLNQSQKQKYSNRQFNTKSLCSQCFIYSLKLQQLTSSYEQLLLCKNQELKSCRDIISKLQQKTKEIQFKYKLEIDKNRKFKHYVENKSFSQQNTKKQVSQAVQYLKKREINLIQNLTKIQKELYVKEIHQNDQILQKLNESTQSNQIQRHSQIISENSQQNNSQNRINYDNNNITNTIEIKTFAFELPQVNMHQYIKKCNQLELAHDNILVLSIENKIQTVKHLEDALLKNVVFE